MNYIIFNTQNEAQSFSNQIDQAFGYPKCTCIKCGGPTNGGGFHTPCDCNPPTIDLNCDNVTLKYAEIIKHPTQNQWAYLADSAVLGTGVYLPSQPTTLDQTWGV